MTVADSIAVVPIGTEVGGAGWKAMLRFGGGGGGGFGTLAVPPPWHPARNAVAAKATINRSHRLFRNSTSSNRLFTVPYHAGK